MSKVISAWTYQEGSERAIALFQQTFGGQPDGVWASPGRVNLIGEHVDYNGGLCLPMALPHRTFTALKKRSDRVVRMIPLTGGDPLWEGTLDSIYPGADIPTWVCYAGGPVWALLQEPDLAPAITSGFDAAIAGNVPLGAGLSSSAAIECSVAFAVDEAYGLGLAGSTDGRTRIAQAGIRAENEVAGAATGGLDQSASVHAQSAHALLLDCLDGSFQQIPFDLSARGLRLLVVDTMAHHSLNDGQYESRRRLCETVAAREGVATLRELPDPEATLARLSDPVEHKRVRHVVTEIARVQAAAQALAANEYERLGQLFYESHSSLRDDYEVSAPELDLTVQTAQENGALGARMTGGGFGGSAIALVREEDIDTISQAIADAFAEQGWIPPRFIDAYAADGGGRVCA